MKVASHPDQCKCRNLEHSVFKSCMETDGICISVLAGNSSLQLLFYSLVLGIMYTWTTLLGNIFSAQELRLKQGKRFSLRLVMMHLLISLEEFNFYLQL